MGMLKEFKDFAMRGNVIDLAVGVVIGAAFGKVVTSLVDQIIMPPIGLATGGVDFSNLKWVLKPADPANKVAEVAIQYGAFINTIITFLIIALAIFLMVKAINRISRKPEAAPAAPPADVVLLTEIRDLLKSKG
jgi:large conductance mechanosensitive channel